MSADTLAAFAVDDSIYDSLISYSSNTPEGAAAIWAQELERYASQAGVLPSNVVLAFPTDPLVTDQWHLLNVGQQVGNPDFQNIFGIPGEDINVAPVWNNGITGEGVVVGVFEVGGIFETTHPDLAANVDPILAFTSPSVQIADHATSVAGIIGAVGDNGIGGTGVAPGVILVPMGDVNAVSIPDAIRFAADNGIDITNNSWGPGGGRSLGGPTANEILALRDSVLFGRLDENGDPLGVIHVFSSGNSASSVGAGPPALDSSSFNGWVNSRYTIGVTGVDHDGLYNNVDGTVTGYMEIGASVLVAAPTGSNPLSIFNDTGIGSGIFTTDLTGEDGYNGSDNTGPPTGDRDFLDDIDYTSRFNGTSAAAPMVSGVIALMLEANPNLSWRDVQEILIRSARQNSEFATMADGVDKTVGFEYQNTWIANQVPLFHDPDIYDPLIDNGLQILNPTLDPGQTVALNAIHYAPTPQVLTNAAGYTVSQGRGTNAEQTGFAHGVVDAELAVLMAEQWNTKDQNLPDELSFTTAVGFNRAISLPAAEVVNDIFGAGTTDLIIPGGLGGDPGFSDYWAEYLVDDPDFTQGFFERGAPLELTVPSPNDMTIETIELSFQTAGDITEFMDNVRVVLVSPNGTHSELNPYFVDPSFDANENIHQVEGPNSALLTVNGFNGVSQNVPDFLDPGSVDSGITTLTYSTNRSWGERSDDAIIFDPSTAEPVIDLFGVGGNRFNLGEPFAGDLLTQGWQLYMENYSPVDLDITDFEITWHGSPIDPGTERVQGLIGIDDNQDDLFNYSRVIQQISQIDLDPALRFGEVQNIIDPDHESMASNITVFAHRDVNSNGILDGADILVDQFVTGADGNYYFDLVPDNYIFSLDESSLGDFTALDDSLTPAGFVSAYQSEWAVTTDFFNVWDYELTGGNLEAPVDPLTGAPVPFLDGSGSVVTYGMKDINFLLDPGTPPAPQVDFSGTVFADINGDGLFNGDDVAVPGVGVFGDVNRNGALDAGEILVETDANGEYLLTVPLPSFPTPYSTVMNVGVRPPANWTPSNPDLGYQPFFVERGDTFADVDFHITPPLGSTPGDGSALSGIVLGTVFNDKNGDTVRQNDEFGVPNITVYLDMNNSGAIDAGDEVTKTNSNGAYAFANVPDGSHFFRVFLDPDSGISQTFPDFELPQFASINSGGTVTGILFGISSGSGGSGGVLDFGDLPNIYGTTLAANGARHPEGIFFLGAMIDSEPDGFFSNDAKGDDDNFLNDEDGVVLAGGVLVPDSTGTLTVTASRHGGYLQAWFDYNDDGDFNDIVDGVSEQVIVNRLLDPGANVVTFAIPDTLGASTIYARFRYGEFGLGSTGLAQVGEVEDYAFDVLTPDPPLVVIHGPDFNEDGVISGADFLAWQRGFGKTENAVAQDGDSDSDGDVDAQDLSAWESEYGAQPVAAAVQAQTGDFDQNGRVDGSDFLAWQSGAGTVSGASLSDGDGNLDGSVDSVDLSTWEASYGADYSGSSASLAIASSVEAASRGVLAPALLPASDTLEQQVSEEAVDTTPASEKATYTSDFASVASEAYQRFGRGRRIDRQGEGFQRLARIESNVIDTAIVDSIAKVDLGSELRVQAVERLFGRRHRLFDQLPHKRDSEGDLADSALETALGEETQWRYF